MKNYDILTEFLKGNLVDEVIYNNINLEISVKIVRRILKNLLNLLLYDFLFEKIELGMKQ
jgi:hypothetical protein